VSSEAQDTPALRAILDAAAVLAAEQGRATVRVRDLADALAAAHADVPPIPIVRLQEGIAPLLDAARASAGAAPATVDHLLAAMGALRTAASPAVSVPAAPVPQRRGVRTGIGYDSHRFAPGGPLVLGGLSLESDLHLAGHSDGDAIAHAVTDAMLGAANAGDIGALFPDTDPAHAGRDSIDMLQRAHERVVALGWAVTYVDVTVIAEYPKIGPHRAAMCARVAAALGLSADAVSIKGKTNETMGFVGRREGLAVIAVATIEPALP
jgi:2-C-methyl-D-erythritol 2,4-cyclodiphosphate synthase